MGHIVAGQTSLLSLFGGDVDLDELYCGQDSLLFGFDRYSVYCA